MTIEELRKLYDKTAEGMTDDELIDMDRRLGIMSNAILDRVERLDKNNPKELKRIIKEGERLKNASHRGT